MSEFVPDLSSPAATVASYRQWADTNRQHAKEAVNDDERVALIAAAENADEIADDLAKAFGL